MFNYYSYIQQKKVYSFMRKAILKFHWNFILLFQKLASYCVTIYNSIYSGHIKVHSKNLLTNWFRQNDAFYQNKNQYDLTAASRKKIILLEQFHLVCRLALLVGCRVFSKFGINILSKGSNSIYILAVNICWWCYHINDKHGELKANSAELWKINLCARTCTIDARCKIIMYTKEK